MGFTIELKTADVQAVHNLLADVEEVALKGNFWRKEHDPWDGFVQEIDDKHALITLRNCSDQGLSLQMTLHRHRVSEEDWRRLGVGCWFQFEFTSNGVELKFL